MKKIILGALISFVLFTGCEKDSGSNSQPSNSCKETTEETHQNINVFDFTPGSPYYNNAISVFKLKKESINRTGNCSGLPSLECENSLTIQNTTNKKVTYSFIIEYRLNYYNWTYQNTVTINANSTIDLGNMNSNCGSLSLASIIIRLSGVTYQ